jgi:lysozyme
MTYLDILRAQLPIDEGRRSKPYRDSVGKLTIGCGRNLDDVGLRPDEIALCLENDINVAEQSARRLVPNFDDLNEVRKAVVINMVFNMGESRVAGFVNMLHAIRDGRYGAAADHMLDSKWAKQVGERANRLAAQMKAG